jgi:hypothetical protein
VVNFILDRKEGFIKRFLFVLESTKSLNRAGARAAESPNRFAQTRKYPFLKRSYFRLVSAVANTELA